MSQSAAVQAPKEKLVDVLGALDKMQGQLIVSHLHAAIMTAISIRPSPPQALMVEITNALGKYLSEDKSIDATVLRLAQLCFRIERNANPQWTAAFTVLHLVYAVLLEHQSGSLLVMRVHAKAALLLLLDTTAGEGAKEELAMKLYPVLAVLANEL